VIPPVASRFVAGETVAEALDRTRRVNDDGVGVILNLLGEHHRDRAAVAADAATYRRLLADIGDSDLRACVSVKPTQLGLSMGEGVFREVVAEVAAAAADAGVFLWLDMEDSRTTDATLAAYRDLAAEHGDVGVCVQANLRRTPADLAELAGTDGKVRLVKGAYDEPAAVAHRGRGAVDDAFEECLKQMFREFEDGVAVGSHDPRMVALTRELAAEHDTGFEVQMLMGVREDAQRELSADLPVFQYVPFGSAWASYFLRRVGERRGNLTFAVRAVLGG
jgi:proline dehydrogenase